MLYVHYFTQWCLHTVNIMLRHMRKRSDGQCSEVEDFMLDSIAERGLEALGLGRRYTFSVSHETVLVG